MTLWAPVQSPDPQRKAKPLILFFFFFGLEACRFLVPDLRWNLCPLQCKLRVLVTGVPRKSQGHLFFLPLKAEPESGREVGKWDFERECAV